MRRSLRFFVLSLKRMLRSRIFCAVILLLPLVCFLLSQVSTQSESSGNTVLLYCENPDSLTGEIFTDLVKGNSETTYVVAKDEAAMIDTIARGDAICGYLFPDQLETLILSGNSSGSILLYSSDHTGIALLSRELVYSSMLHRYADVVAEEFFVENTRYEENLSEILSEYPAVFTQMQADADSVSLEFRQVSGTGLTESSDSGTYSLSARGLCAVLLFVMGLFGVGLTLEDEEKGLTKSFRGFLKRTSIPFSLSAMLLPLSASVLVCLYVSGEGMRSLSGFFTELSALCTYLLLLIAFCSVLAEIFRKSVTAYALLPPFTVFSLILCPVFLDFSQFFSVISWLNKIFPPTYYLGSLNYAVLYIPVSLLLTVLLFVLYTLLARYRTSSF